MQDKEVSTHSIYSKFFYSKKLNRNKYSVIKEHAEKVLELKNKVSEYFCENFHHCISLSSYDFRNLMRELFPIGKYFDEQIYGQVYRAYKMKSDAIKKKLTFKESEIVKTLYYKIDYKEHKAGEVRKVIYRYFETDYTKTMSFLAKWNSDEIGDIIPYINRTIEKIKDDEKSANRLKLYQIYLDVIKNNNFAAMWKTARETRRKVLDEYLVPCKFTKLTFDGRINCYKNDFIIYDKDTNEYSIKISINNKFIRIPVEYSNDYHGKLKDYNKKKSAAYMYRLELTDKSRQVKITYSVESDKHRPDMKIDEVCVIDITKCKSYDINTADNVMSDSEGNLYNILRKDVDKLEKLLVKTDKIKTGRDDNYLGKSYQKTIDALKRSISGRIQRLVRERCVKDSNNGYEFIVLENLTGCFGRQKKRKDPDKVKSNRMSENILHISSIKDEFLHIAPKYGLKVILVPSNYTSQMCNKCGHVEEGNRDGRDFCCRHCGHTGHADLNSAKNILLYFTDEILRSKLLTFNKDTSIYEPKAGLNSNKILEILTKRFPESNV